MMGSEGGGREGEAHESAILGSPALVAFPAAVLVLPLPGSSMVTAPFPAGSKPTGALLVVMGGAFMEAAASAHYFRVSTSIQSCKVERFWLTSTPSSVSAHAENIIPGQIGTKNITSADRVSRNTCIWIIISLQNL